LSGPADGAGDGQTGVSVAALVTEQRSNPLGIDAAAPRLSWQLRSERRGVLQSAYQIQVAESAEALSQGGPLLWDSAKLASDESVLRPYGGPAPQSGHRYWWQVRVWDEQGRLSAWSAPAYWEMGLLHAADWSAQWIEPAPPQDPAGDYVPPLLRKEFSLHGRLRSARAYVTSHGLYELYLNGRRVGEDLLTPGWTSYDRRLSYQVYDVTTLLTPGANAAGAMLADGWYRGRLVNSRNHYGDTLGLLLQLRLDYEDGSSETVISDASWRASTGPIRMSEIYLGETYDARLEKAGWSKAGYDDRDWSGVRVVPATGETLVAEAGAPVRRHEELKPLRIFRTPKGETVVDMGQNMVGWVRLRVQGPAGTEVKLRHAEVVDATGNLYTDNLRTASQEIRYTLSGHGVETYEPHFSYQGFRYVAVEGYPGTLTQDSLTGIVLYADMAQTGSFETSDPLLNQLQHNILWSEKGNFLAVPSDCPQRDERLGWTGDAQVFAPTAAFNLDVSRFLASWLADLAADQHADGGLPWVIPDIPRVSLKLPVMGAAGWGDAGLLAAQYPSMARWVDFERQQAGDKLIWSGGFQFGDWLDFGSEQRQSKGITSTDLISTAYLARSAWIVAQAAAVLGKPDDAARYTELFERVRQAFQQQFVQADGKVGAGTQTAYVLALDFDLLPEAQRPFAAQRLAQNLQQDGHLTTGFLGTPHLLQVLSRYGHLDAAYQLLQRRDFPSWLYPVTHGATTMWERWDGIKPDGSFEDAGMNSFNHYAYGAVGEWMYQTIAGIDLDPALPGYKRMLIRPQPGGGLSQASASLDTPYGTVESAWSDQGGVRTLKVRIPANTRASLRLPDAAADQVREGGQALAGDAGLLGLHPDGTALTVELGSGQYAFSYPLAAAPAQTGAP
jgi:alpha-L-rhamnosidase